MDFCHLSETLGDERCGLYFLAGMDLNPAAAGTGVVTIHAAEGALNNGHQDFIESVFAAQFRDYDVRFRFHSSEELHCPDSLESFARSFRHDHIVSDPTGAFTRVAKLLELVRDIRAELGSSVDRILWRSETSALVVLATGFQVGETGTAEDDRLNFLHDQVSSLIRDRAAADLKKAIRSVHVNTEMPAGRYTHVDEGHRAAQDKSTGLTGMFARISGIAALIGLGTISAASASVPALVEDDGSLTPGVAALVGLTTLGENSYGLRNHYQAVGGLRLYFGKTDGSIETGLLPGAPGSDEIALTDTPSPDGAKPTGEPNLPAPSPELLDLPDTPSNS
ncbi:hypothetical protein [Nitratireductor sp. XY-223]|uniref:hypothetical protein n=1 Tax=Nitratireductor sp. XY-223 TaxID=2561926 RepID=UPI0010AA20CA|nr:hypothetical protein [Nitratireductor sp. XY-223]